MKSERLIDFGKYLEILFYGLKVLLFFCLIVEFSKGCSLGKNK